MGKGEGAFSVVKPFLPVAGIFAGIALLIDGLSQEFVPCIVGYSPAQSLIQGSCASLYGAIVVVGIVVTTASAFAAVAVYNDGERAGGQVVNDNPERKSCKEGRGRKRFALLAGVALTALGAALYVFQYVNDWNCAQVPTSCLNSGPFDLSRLLFDYPLMAVGLVLLAYSLLGHRHQRRNREDSHHQ